MFKRQVVIMEFERGWGSNIVSIEYFESDKLAKERIEQFNARNTSKTVPDWYMIAVLGEVVDIED